MRWENQLVGVPNFTEPPVLDVSCGYQTTLAHKKLNAPGNSLIADVSLR